MPLTWLRTLVGDNKLKLVVLMIAGMICLVVAIHFLLYSTRPLAQSFECLWMDCLAIELPRHEFDLAVSFETIEHIDGDQVFFGRIFEALKSGGRFVCSTPNQVVTPFSADKYPFHRRHYTLDEISALLTSNGFEIEKVLSQYGKHKKDVVAGSDGAFHIIVSRKS